MSRTPSSSQFPNQRHASRACCMGARSRCHSRQKPKRCFHRNQQYSTSVITDASAAVVERYAYSAYGTPTITDASGTTRTTTAIGNRYSYTGREWDETLALYHYRARMYDSVGGRFVSQDPIGYEGGISLFAYVMSSPLSLLDPLGFAPEGSKCNTFNGSGCLRVSDLRFTGAHWGDMGFLFVGDKWWLRAAQYISGDLQIQMIMNDTVNCCCPDRQVHVHGVIDVRLQFDYIEVAERWQMLKQMGQTLFFPMFIKGLLARELKNDVSDALAKAMIGAGIEDFTATGICKSKVNNVEFNSSIAIEGLKIGDPPGRGSESKPFSADIHDFFQWLNGSELRWCPGSGFSWPGDNPVPHGPPYR